MRFILPWTG